MEVVLMRSNRGGEKIFVENFGYHFRSRNAKDVYRWVCTERKSLNCKSKVMTRKFGDKHQVTESPTEHNHSGLEYNKLVRIKVEAEQKATLKSSQISQNDETDPLAGKLLSLEEVKILEKHRTQPKKRQKPHESDEHSSSSLRSYRQKLQNKTVDNSCGQKNKRKSDENMESKTIRLSEESLHINDVKIEPKRKAFVRSDQESDGTVNIRIFLEESLLSSFVVNAQHTSNVNIRISKDDL